MSRPRCRLSIIGRSWALLWQLQWVHNQLASNGGTGNFAVGLRTVHAQKAQIGSGTFHERNR